MNFEEALRLLNGAIPMADRLKKDQRQIKAFYDDWKDAVDREENSANLSTLYGIPTAIAMKMPTSFSLNFDPFKPARILCDEFARALNFERYKKLRSL